MRVKREERNFPLLLFSERERDNQAIVLLLFLNIFLAIADDYATEGLAHALASEVEG